MKKLIFIALGALAIAGCPACSTVQPVVQTAEQKAADSVVAALQTQCPLAHADVATADVLAAIQKIIPAKGNKGAIGDMICAPIISGLFDKGCQSLPATWGASGSADSSAKAAIIAYCQAHSPI